MGLFTPRYLKDARFLSEAASKTLHHHRDLLREDQITGLQGQIAALNAGIAARDEAAISRLTRDLEVAFSGMIPAKAHAAWAENIEAIVVAVALAVGFQAYFLKPFKIPTGSMQPTLYGMTGNPTTVPFPNIFERWIEFIRLGRTYIDVKATMDETIEAFNERTRMNFFTFTDIITSEGITSQRNIKISSPAQSLLEDIAAAILGSYYHNGIRTIFSPANALTFPSEKGGFGLSSNKRTYKSGETILHGYVQAGDQVFVDRMTYQFRNPARADVFVFKTTGIPGIEESLRRQNIEGSQFYIKRLAGLPRDTLRIDSPKLFLNGKEATNASFRRVMSCENGYRGYSNPSAAQYLGTPEETFTVPARSYFALGDNSYNSSDSRYWGIVPERNVIGRGFFVYWPFSSRWGFIR